MSPWRTDPVFGDEYWESEFVVPAHLLEPRPDTREETVRLAVESARRWAARRDLSADVRLRRMWTVLTTALEAS